jgi:NAD(P)-dependent dehydrogenase (short-subunit alcohol dehydrogenase family)
MHIKDAVALVTGANRGLGQAFVELLLAGGAKVYAAARDPSKVSVPGVTSVRLDVTREEDCQQAARDCPDVNLLVNNAGIARMSSWLEDDSLDNARDELETNCFGLVRTSRAFAPVLARNGGGAIVNVLSVLSWVSGLPPTATYAASKAAAWSLTNSIRAELVRQCTQVIGLHVGLMDTDMAHGFDAPKASPHEVVRQTLQAVERGELEVLADEMTRQVKRGLSEPRAIYLGPVAAAVGGKDVELPPCL